MTTAAPYALAVYRASARSIEDAGACAAGWRASLGLLVVLGCSGESGGTGPVKVATITVNVPLTQLLVGQTTSATATLRDGRGNELSDRSVTWESTNPVVIAVSASGMSATATAVSQGTAIIAATSEGVTGQGPALLVTMPFIVAELSAGWHHTCGRTSEGVTYCWGINVRVPTAVDGGVRFIELAAGLEHTCARTSTGAAYCWGDNRRGQLGDGTTSSRALPTQVSGGLSFVELSAGQFHTCGRTSTGAAYCWGDNRWGQCGDGTQVDRLVPTRVIGGLQFVELAAGGVHTCARTALGAVYCWGSNGEGELGDGTFDGRLVPTLVIGGLSFVELSAGGEHTCGRTSSGAAYCWGLNFSGEVGDGRSDIFRPVPTPVSGGLSFVEISAGGFHTCGRVSDGAAYCWGVGRFGRLGDGSTTGAAYVPVPVTGALSFIELAAGNEHTCGRISTGAAYCWGLNQSGQLGDGSFLNRSVPTAVSGPAR